MSDFKFDEPVTVGTNLHARVDCTTCGGDRMVVYSRRAAEVGGWQKARGLKASGEIKEYAPCPDCNPNANTKRQGFKSPDPAQVRRRLSE